eukprot:CAMPEP_0117025040 /NCGR_PEP_ID=MMETSP0472-20121206/18540_1 /TAXON_ID=693140 ORGANISM="Tiarina fusus, Strain LIS" /NCGR_SAMPLE_ID=MMETSP0472 /ASSEMBLY_ACC=CAM_ASM_000603 /LENGTH=212 /DNA_ID=CAMNT_0004731651 /DNA_START=2460 /DNA_END=3098 /DNA_ORIENTATION=-
MTKLKEEIDLQLSSIRILENDGTLFQFSVSRRNHGELILGAASELELEHWVDALSSHSEVPSVSVNVENYWDTALVTTSASGKIDGFNKCAQKLFGYNKADVMGEPITFLIPGDKQVQKFIKHQIRDVIGKPMQLKCQGKNDKLFLVVCFAEFTDNGAHKIIARFRPEIELSEELQYVVDQDFQLMMDEIARDKRAAANCGGNRIVRANRMF